MNGGTATHAAGRPAGRQTISALWRCTLLALVLGAVPAPAATAARVESAAPQAPAATPPQPPTAPAETVVVIGAAPGIETSPAAASTEVPRTHIERRTPEHLTQLLETIPGVGAVSEGHATVPAVRGLARGRTLLLVDGARVSAERRVGPAATFLDPIVVETVAVARGPGSVAYGSDAIGGVVAVRTRQALAGQPWSMRMTAQAGVGVPLRRAGIATGGGIGRAGVFLSLHGRQSDDYDGPRARVANSSWADHGALVSFTQALLGGLAAARYQADSAIDVERPRNNATTVRIVNPFERSHRVTLNWERTAAAGRGGLRVTGFHGWSEQRTDQQALDLRGQATAIECADISARDLQVRVSLHRLLSQVLFEGGTDVYGRYGLLATDGSLTLGPTPSDIRALSIDGARRVATGAFLRASVPVTSRLTLSSGLRGDAVRTRNRGGAFGANDTHHAVLTGFAAAAVRLTSALTVTGQASRGFRDPTLSDRYFRGPSGRGFITGNPDLRPEYSRQFDIATRYALPFGQIAVYGYDYRMIDLIERYAAAPDRFQFRNRGDARLRGLELETTSVGPRGLSFELAGHLARGTGDTGNPLDDVTPPTVSLTVRQDLAGRGFVQARAAAISRHGRPGPNEVVSPGGTVVDLGAGLRLHPRLDLRCQVRNALDTTLYASPDPRWVYAPGRSFSITVNVGR